MEGSFWCEALLENDWESIEVDQVVGKEDESKDVTPGKVAPDSCSFVICSIVGRILVLWKGLNCWGVKHKGNYEKTALWLKSTKHPVAAMIVAPL